MNYHLSIQDGINALSKEEQKRFVTLMQNGTMSVEYYEPVDVDPQTPHKQDELYVIASGRGTFYRNGEQVQIKQGDVLFVPSGMEHRFENFSDGFATWVIFYGPRDGESK